MNQESTRERTAQPAEEELKKHGDQLKKPVDAASSGVREQDGEQRKKDEDRKTDSR